MGVPPHIVRLTAHMLDLVIATCSTLLRIHRRQKLDGQVSVWRLGHVLNVNATSKHLVPENGFAQAGRKCAGHLHITPAPALVRWILHSITRLCFQNGPRAAGRIGSVRDSDVEVDVAQEQLCQCRDLGAYVS